MFPRTALSDITSLSMCLVCCCYSLYLFKLAWFEIDLVDVIDDYFIYFFSGHLLFTKAHLLCNSCKDNSPAEIW